jgi:hypothetical protein
MTGGIAPNSLLAALALISIFFLIIWALRAARLVIEASREVIKPKRGA